MCITLCGIVGVQYIFYFKLQGNQYLNNFEYIFIDLNFFLH